MKVRLISSSKPSRELASEGLYDAQELVAYCARVSNPANQFNAGTSEKLINKSSKLSCLAIAVF